MMLALGSDQTIDFPFSIWWCSGSMAAAINLSNSLAITRRPAGFGARVVRSDLEAKTIIQE